MQNPYNEGLRRAGALGATVDDCPYSSALMARERQQWLDGVASRRTGVSRQRYTAAEQYSEKLHAGADAYA